MLYLEGSAAGTHRELAGPVGERNVYRLKPRGIIAALAQTQLGALLQIGAVLATGNRAVIQSDNPAANLFASLPSPLQSFITLVADWREIEHLGGVLHEGEPEALAAVNQAAAALEGPIVLVQGVRSAGLAAATEAYSLVLLMTEISISTNTAAAGGNASLMTLG